MLALLKAASRICHENPAMPQIVLAGWKVDGAMDRSRRWQLIAAITLSMSAGCGGGGGGNSGGGGASQETPVQLSIDWGGRSRGVTGPPSSLSARLSITAAKGDGTDLTYVVNRESAPAAYSRTYTTTEKLKPGNWPVLVRFYAQANGAGPLVGVAQKTATIAADGTGIGNIATSGTVSRVVVPAGQTLAAGATEDLAFTALDVNNSVIAVTPGSAFFVVASGSDKMDIVGGQAHGLAPGPATVTATVDGHISQAQSVSVTSSAAVSVNPNSPSVAVGATQTFTANVSNAPDAGVTWAVLEANGGTINAAGLYVAPSGAGTYHVVATSKYDTSKSASDPVIVHLTVATNPVAATLTLRDQKVFSATVIGTTNTGVTWSLQEGAAAGSVSATGVYTAPSAAGVFHLIATSNADPSQRAAAIVTVQAGSATGTIK
jgi:hypothetical protein